MMKTRKSTYRKPQTSTERIKHALMMIESTQSAGFGQRGEFYWKCVEIIKHWQAVIDQELQT